MNINADPIVIVLTCDDRYVRHAAATMVSIVKPYLKKTNHEYFVYSLFNYL